uniref:GST N-terminal domain-containing protein n=1 Tax=Cucumis melo TaxID=3656 RepID=A0A9I9EAF2_CUCME
VQEIPPPSLDATAEQPPLFDGTTRLYTAYICPYAHRAWIIRNYKGLQHKIKLVPLDLRNRPDWYKEKVYPTNKVPSLEHNGKVIGESLDLLKYIDSNFEGPSLLPDDPAKREFAEELLSYSETFNGAIINSFKGDTAKEACKTFQLDRSLRTDVDIAYIPFVERFHIFLSEALKIDVTEGRPKLVAWMEEFNKIDAYKQTKVDPELS